LGTVTEARACSPYYIHKTFLRSPSQFFSGSAGAIYPAVKRLEAKGYLKSVRAGTAGKPSKKLTITPTGTARYLEWYYDPTRAADAGYDPVRVRISLLGSLPPAQQKKAYKELLEIGEHRLKYLATLNFEPCDGAGMDQAREIEKATLKAKLALLKGWKS